MKHPSKISKIYLFKLSVPIFFANLAIPLVGLVDTGLMGHAGEEKFLVATSIGTAVITMIFWSFGFLRMGTTGLVAQALGRGDYRGIVMTVIRNVIIGFFAVVGVTTAVVVGITSFKDFTFLEKKIETKKPDVKVKKEVKKPEVKVKPPQKKTDANVKKEDKELIIVPNIRYTMYKTYLGSAISIMYFLSCS